jgi:hypothetical protein
MAQINKASANGDTMTIDAHGGIAIAEGASFTYAGTAVTLATDGLQAEEVAYLTDVTPGTLAASKAVVVDENSTIDALTVTALTATLTGDVTGSLTGPAVTFNGATTENEITVPTNLADALSVKDSAGDLIVADTRTGAQRITVTPATTFTGAMTATGGVSGAATIPVNKALTFSTTGTAHVFTVTGGNIIVTGVPTTDPAVAGALWANNGVLTLSSGE